MAEEKKELSLQLKDLEKAGANLLMPSTEIAGLSEFHAPVIEKVFVSADPNDGDVYDHDGAQAGPKKKWRLTKQALMKLSVCAGVIWSPTESRRIDNGADRNYIAYRAVGGIRKADGQPVFFSGEYDIDFEVLEQELTEQYTKKANGTYNQGNPWKKTQKEKDEYIQFCVKRDMLDKRKFKLRLCESGAMNRVLRMLLGIKQAYTTEELAKPFVMARIVFRPDFSDKEVRQQFIEASIKSMVGIYGPGAAAALPERIEPINITPIPPEKEPEEGNGNGKEPGAGQGAACKTEEKETKPPTTDMFLTDFKSMNLEEKAKAITTVATRKGYDLAGFLKRAARKSALELKPEKMTELYTHLLGLKDKEEEDIPF